MTTEKLMRSGITKTDASKKKKGPAEAGPIENTQTTFKA
jgi:hypothetical protein